MKFAEYELRILPKEVDGHVETSFPDCGSGDFSFFLLLRLFESTCAAFFWPAPLVSGRWMQPTFSSLLIDNFSRDSLFLTSASNLLKSVLSGQGKSKFFFGL
jgi:hypothetical protein